MLELVETKDMKWIVTKLQEVMDRTKRHTEQIRELQKQIKEIRK